MPAGNEDLAQTTILTNATVTALSGSPGATSLYIVGLDEGHGGGRVWTNYYPTSTTPASDRHDDNKPTTRLLTIVSKIAYVEVNQKINGVYFLSV